MPASSTFNNIIKYREKLLHDKCYFNSRTRYISMITTWWSVLFVVRSLIISPQYLIRLLQNVLSKRSMKNRQTRPMKTIYLIENGVSRKFLLSIIKLIYSFNNLKCKINQLLFKSLSKILFDINIKDFCKLFSIICSRKNVMKWIYPHIGSEQFQNTQIHWKSLSFMKIGVTWFMIKEK